MSFHFPSGFYLFHYSCELCSAWRNAASWIVCSSPFPSVPLGRGAFEYGNLFLTFDTGVLVLEHASLRLRQSVSQLSGIPYTFIHLRDRLHCHRHTAGALASLPVPTLHLPVNIPICVWRSVQTAPTIDTFVACAIQQKTKWL